MSDYSDWAAGKTSGGSAYSNYTVPTAPKPAYQPPAPHGPLTGFVQSAGNFMNRFIKNPLGTTYDSVIKPAYEGGKSVGAAGAASLNIIANKLTGDNSQAAKQDVAKLGQQSFLKGLIDPNKIDKTGKYTGPTPTATQARQAVGQGVSDFTNMTSILPAGKVAKEAVGSASLVKKLAQGVLEGGKFGAAQGTGQALQEKNLTPSNAAKDIAVNTLVGAGVAAAGTGALHAGSAASKAIISNLTEKAGQPLRTAVLQHILANMPKDEVPHEPVKVATVTSPPVAPRPSTAIPVTIKPNVHLQVAKAEQQLSSHPNASPHELNAINQLSSTMNLTPEQHLQLVQARLGDLNANGGKMSAGTSTLMSTLSGKKVQPIQPKVETAPVDQHVANGQANVQAKQAAAEKANGKPAPLSGILQQRLEQIKAKHAEYMNTRYGNTPSPGEMAKSDANAAASKPQDTGQPAAARPQPVVAEKVKPAPKPTSFAAESVPVNKSKMAPNETGSAHSNQGSEPGSRQVTSQSADKGVLREPAQGKDTSHANMTQVTNKDTGDIFAHKNDGSAVSELHNKFLQEKKNATGTSGRDITKVHGGFAASHAIHIHNALAELDKVLSTKDWHDLPHYLEGTLKDHQVSPELKANKNRIQELDNLSYAVHKENNPAMNELDNHTRHIYTGPVDRAKGLFNRFSTKAGTQMGRTVAKFTDAKGKVKVGNPEKMGLIPEGKNRYSDNHGNTWHAETATLRDKLDAGMSYETNGRVMLKKQLEEALKVHNNASLVRELTSNSKFSRDIKSLPKGEQVPQGFSRVKIAGMENHIVSDKMHGHIYTLADKTASRGEKLVNLALKPFDVVNHLAIKAFFTANPLGHMPNLIVQHGLGSGLHGGPKGTVDMMKNLGWAADALKSKNKELTNYLEGGGSLGLHQDGPVVERSGFSGAIHKVTGALGIPLKLGGKINNFTDTVGKMAAVKNLVDKEGLSMHEAVKKVDGVIGDYGNLNKFEKNVMTRAVFFYPFFKIMAKSIGVTAKGVASKDIKSYAGVALNGAIMFGVYQGINAGLQAATGNKYASMHKGGALGLIDTLIKAPGQIARGNIPSLISSRVPPAQKEIIEQLAGSGILSDNKPIDKSTMGRIAHAGTMFAQVAGYENAMGGKKTAAEIALNTAGIQLPHGPKSAAAPAIGKDSPLSIINEKGSYSQVQVDAEKKAEAQFVSNGGSKLEFLQAQRLTTRPGDNSGLDKFFAGKSNLDPLSSDFQGTQAGSQQVKAGMATAKANGQTLAYMQSMKESGSTYFDKFFSSNPTLDPSSKDYVPKNAKATAEAKYQAKSVKYAYQKASAGARARIAVPKASGGRRVSVPGMSKGAPRAKNVMAKTKTFKLTVPKAHGSSHVSSLLRHASKLPAIKSVKVAHIKLK